METDCDRLFLKGLQMCVKYTTNISINLQLFIQFVKYNYISLPNLNVAIFLPQQNG